MHSLHALILNSYARFAYSFDACNIYMQSIACNMCTQ